MRPIKLTLQAFGPYVKPLTLDFEKNLHGEKIFLINGATGAGKTTILDAICFALYGTASGDERDGAMMRSKGISPDEKTAVEFTFALGEKIYSVRRTLTHRPNRKTNQNQIAAELRRDGELLETQTTRVTNAINELLGFKSEQFRQVVLLPQGEFKNFLAAGSADRQPILNALFNAELYTRIEEGLKLKADAAQKIFDDLTGEKRALTAGLQDATLDETALEKLRADYDAARKKSAEAKKFFDAAQSECTAAEILGKDFAELERRDKALQTAQNNLADAEKNFAAAKTEYDRRAAEQTLRDKFKSDVDELTKIKRALDELQRKNSALTTERRQLQRTTADFELFDERAKRYQRRLDELGARKAEFAGADVKFEQLKALAERAGKRDTLLKEISRRQKILEMEREKLAIITEKFTAAQIELNRLQIVHSAAHLAMTLRDGEPCPVCGSLAHPAIIAEAIPAAAELHAAEKKLERLTNEKTLQERTVNKFVGELSALEDQLQDFSEVPASAAVQKNFDEARANAAALADCLQRIEKGDRCLKENRAALDDAVNKKNSATVVVAKLESAIAEAKRTVPEKYLDDPWQLDDDLAAAQKTLDELDDAWKNADKNFRAADNKKSSCEGALKSAQESQRDLADKLKGSTPPDVDALRIRAADAQNNLNEAIRAETSLKNKLDERTSLASQIAALDKKISAAEKNLRVWKKLSDAACGKIRGNKLSFARYYLGAMFEQVLTEANYRVYKMSDRRYNLKSKFAGERVNSNLGLNLEIFDEYTGETRPVATLSGGESFLASLSLALGLAAVVRNNSGGIKLDTIFIDEGFGSLDSETLDDAIATIIEQSGGRLVGIISHVEELKNQMPVRLEVAKNKTGSTAKFRRGLSRD